MSAQGKDESARREVEYLDDTVTQLVKNLEAADAALAAAREALREIATAKFAVALEIGSSVDYRQCVRYLQRVARKALGESEVSA